LPLWQIEKRRDIPDFLPGTAASFMPVERVFLLVQLAVLMSRVDSNMVKKD
jgi:hypothetical protein